MPNSWNSSPSESGWFAELWRSLPAGVGVFDADTLAFAEWRSYTNPRTKKSGWISEGGLVRYDDPRKKEEETRQARVSSAEAVARAVRHPDRLDDADVLALDAHFRTLDAPTLRGIARSLGGRVGKTKKDYADKILDHYRTERTIHEQQRQQRVSDSTRLARTHVAALNTHPALQHQSPTQRRRALDSYQKTLDSLANSSITGDADHVNRVAAAGRADLDRIAAIPFRPRPRRPAPTPAAAPGRLPPATRVNTRRVVASASAAFESGRLFGRDVSAPEHRTLFAAAVNAAEGSSVEVTSYRRDELMTKTTGVGYSASRTIYKEGGKLVCKNGCFFMKFEPDPGNPGPPKDWKRVSPVSGSDLLANQVRALSELGVTKIKTHAARSDGDDPNYSMNGYYTWPRLGYDSEIPARDLAALPQPLKDLVASNPVGSPKANSVLSLMSTPEGRDWWRKNGSDLIHAEFDLTPGSLSVRTHLAYLAERAARGGRE